MATKLEVAKSAVVAAREDLDIAIEEAIRSLEGVVRKAVSSVVESCVVKQPEVAHGLSAEQLANLKADVQVATEAAVANVRTLVMGSNIPALASKVHPNVMGTTYVYVDQIMPNILKPVVVLFVEAGYATRSASRGSVTVYGDVKFSEYSSTMDTHGITRPLDGAVQKLGQARWELSDLEKFQSEDAARSAWDSI